MQTEIGVLGGVVQIGRTGYFTQCTFSDKPKENGGKAKKRTATRARTNTKPPRHGDQAHQTRAADLLYDSHHITKNGAKSSADNQP